MSFLSSSLNILHVVWRIVRIPFLLGVGLAIGFLVPYAWYLDSEVRGRFDDLSWDLPSRVYARPLLLAPDLPMNADMRFSCLPRHAAGTRRGCKQCAIRVRCVAQILSTKVDVVSAVGVSAAGTDTLRP